MRFIPVIIITNRRLLTLGAGWVIHLASASEERKQSGSSGIELFNQARERRQREGLTAPGERTEKLSFAERTNRWYTTARTALAKPTSSSQHPREGSGTKAHDRNQEVGVCPCALRRTEKRHWSVRKSTCRSQSQHFAIRSFLREALRANQSLLPNKLLMLVNVHVGRWSRKGCWTECRRDTAYRMCSGVRR